MSEFIYFSGRMPVYAQNVVATSQPLAVQTGLNILRQGGNAIDAAIATAITLTVVEPTSNGLGSDAFAMVFKDNELSGINGSGRSPAAWSYDQFSKRDKMPTTGWQTVTTPGAVSVWVELSKRFGNLSFKDLFKDAIQYAREGFIVSPITAQAWQKAEQRYTDFEEFKRIFLPNGIAPKVGERFKNEDQARTLEAIANSGGNDFYQGKLAAQIAKAAANDNAHLTEQDLLNHNVDWVKPLAIDYYGVTLHELPPNGQGLAALLTLGMLQECDINQYPLDSVDSLHVQIEAMKMAFHAVETYLADPDWMSITNEDLLRPESIKLNAAKIKMHRASELPYELASDHGTVYLTTADQDGNMVSFIQSNYMGFGSGIVIPGTGISMQNRGHGFSLKQGHPNQIDGNKRPFHTIIPAFVTNGGQPVMSFGVMGGRMQPQGHVQMMVRIFTYQQNPQTASDAPRWCVLEDGTVAIEPHMPESLLQGLKERGHKITTKENQATFGGAQLIINRGGNYIAASDHRKDGLAAGF